LFDIKENEKKVERAVLIGMRPDGITEDEVNIYLDELELLVENLDIPVVGRNVARLRKPQAKFLVGTGKAQEIKEICEDLEADCLIFDEIISPSQQRNWEQLTGICVIDRQEVILDIFSSRAQTREARLQISLARAKYNLPRLTRAWTHLSRQRGGGVGQKGEGEQQIELDKRMIGQRIRKLEKELKAVRVQRETQRKKRRKLPVPNAAIVGYTNAGKSTILNHMTGAEVLAADKLFATLDPTTKPIILPNQQKLLLTDTVGFIRKLPHQLVESFKATLEEAVIADFLLHVCDINSTHLYEHYETTIEVLKEIGVHIKTMIPVFNKIDILEDKSRITEIKSRYPDAVFISSKTGEGIDILQERMARILGEKLTDIKLELPHTRFDLVSLLHRTCDVKSEKYEDDIIYITAAVIPSVMSDIQEYIVR